MCWPYHPSLPHGGPSLISHSEESPNGDLHCIPGLCDTLAPVLKNPDSDLFVSLQGFCSQHAVLRLARAFIDTFDCLREDLPDLPPEGLRANINELLFSRQQDEITVAEHYSPFDVELAGDINPTKFKQKGAKFCRRAGRVFAARSLLRQTQRCADTISDPRDPRRVAFLNCDDFSMSIFAGRPLSSSISNCKGMSCPGCHICPSAG